MNRIRVPFAFFPKYYFIHVQMKGLFSIVLLLCCNFDKTFIPSRACHFCESVRFDQNNLLYSVF